ncbi:hypothetical protein ACFE04_004397 [Oxalis oulophora]
MTSVSVISLELSSGFGEYPMNPSSTQPLVWLAPLKFISKLNDEANALINYSAFGAGVGVGVGAGASIGVVGDADAATTQEIFLVKGFFNGLNDWESFFEDNNNKKKKKKKKKKMMMMMMKQPLKSNKNVELFRLTYSSIVRQLLTDLKEVDEVNEGRS